MKNYNYEYVGEFVNGERNGKGKEFKNVKLRGLSKDTVVSEKYMKPIMVFEGEFKDGKRHGWCPVDISFQ